MNRNIFRSFALALAVAALPGVMAPDLAQANTPKHQDSLRALTAKPAGRVSIAAFPKWIGALQRTWAQQGGSPTACNKKMGADCKISRWQSFLKDAVKLDPVRQLRQVNAYVNATRYRSDRRVWGKRDYWAAPGEFFAKGGDCEDYAVAKYLSLKQLGFDPDKMRIMVLKDTRRGLLHAVLLVEHGGRTLVLDNLSGRLLTWDQVPNYRPLYSVNEQDFWLHPGLKTI